MLQNIDNVKDFQQIKQPEKKVNILQCHHWFPSKVMLRNKHRNSILIKHHYQHLGSTSYWLRQIFSQSGEQPRSGQCYGINEEFVCLFLRCKLLENHLDGIARCWPFSQAIFLLDLHLNKTAKLPVWLSPRVLESIFGQRAFTKECLPPKN